MFDGNYAQILPSPANLSSVSLSPMERSNPKRKSLKLFGSYDSVRQYCEEVMLLNLTENSYLRLKNIDQFDDDLIINPVHFKSHACNLLLSLFPNVKHLLVYFGNKTHFSYLPFLANGWQRQLSHLSICGWIENDFDSHFERLHTLVNSLVPTLQQLDLQIKNKKEQITTPSLFYPLQTLSLSKIHESILQNLGPTLTNLQVDYLFYLSFDELVSNLSSNLNHITKLRLSAFIADKLPKLSESFCNLQSLDLQFNQLPLLSELIEHLSKLKHLTELRLGNVRIDKKNPNKLVNIETIKHLYLFDVGCPCAPKEDSEENYDANRNYDGEHFCRTISSYFPNTEKLVIKCDTHHKNVHSLESIEHNLKFYFKNLKSHNLGSRFNRKLLVGRHRDILDETLDVINVLNR